MDNDQTDDTQLPQEHFEKMLRFARDFRRDALPTDLKWDLSGQHLDSAQSAFTARMLEYLRAGVIAKKYPALKGLDLVPVFTQVPDGARDMTITITDEYGQPAITKDLPGIVPEAETSTSQKSMNFFNVVLGYSFSDDEIENAMFSGIPLQARKALACRTSIERTIDDTVFVGNTAMGVKGLLNQTGTETYTTPNGAGGTKDWPSKTNEEVLLDMNGAVSQVVTASKEILVPNAMILPLTRYEQIAVRRMGDGSDVALLKYFIANQPHVKSVESTYRAESNTGWTGMRGMAYHKDPESMEFILPKRFEQKPPFVELMRVKTVCRARIGGLAMYQPKSAIYFDQI